MGDAPFAVDGSVTPEKLAELMAVGAEHDVLDYKRALDLGRGQDKHRADFVSDVAALSSLPQGGYLLVGVDANGHLERMLPKPNRAQFDEAPLRDLFSRYADGELSLTVAVHQVEDREVAVVYVGPSRDHLPPVMKREGKYLLPSGEARCVFRPGDVLVRVGTSSRRMTHADWPRLLENYRRHVHEQAALDTQVVVGRLAEALRGRSAPIMIDPAMSLPDFGAAVAAAIDANDIASVRRVLRAMPTTRSAWRDPDRFHETEAGLDRLTTVAAVAVEHDDVQVLPAAIDALYEVYTSALTGPGDIYVRPDLAEQAAKLWRAIAARLLGLLAHMVRLRSWTFFSEVVLKPIGPGGDQYTYLSWLRHAVTAAANAHLLVNDQGQATLGALISFARVAVRETPALGVDLTDEEVTRDPYAAPPQGEPDALVTSLCQADFLWCVMAVASSLRTGRRDTSAQYYPSCSAFFDYRTAPIAETVVTDVRIRRALFHDASDADVARAIQLVDDAAGREQVGYGWSIRIDRVNEFIKTHIGS